MGIELKADELLFYKDRIKEEGGKYGNWEYKCKCLMTEQFRDSKQKPITAPLAGPSKPELAHKLTTQLHLEERLINGILPITPMTDGSPEYNKILRYGSTYIQRSGLDSDELAEIHNLLILRAQEKSAQSAKSVRKVGLPYSQSL